MKNKMTTIFAVALSFAVTSSAFAFGKPEHSKVEVAQTKQADGSIALTFKLVPNSDMAVTYDAPWSLGFEPTEEVQFQKPDDAAKNLYKIASFKQDLPGFAVSISPKAGKKSGELSYKLKAFVCTKDKKRCFPETHEGKMKWEG